MRHALSSADTRLLSVSVHSHIALMSVCLTYRLWARFSPRILFRVPYHRRYVPPRILLTSARSLSTRTYSVRPFTSPPLQLPAVLVLPVGHRVRLTIDSDPILETWLPGALLRLIYRVRIGRTLSKRPTASVMASRIASRTVDRSRVDWSSSSSRMLTPINTITDTTHTQRTDWATPYSSKTKS
eukprot:scaffold198803_cov31-Prasinocladus_malaysianus.AAC.1